MARGKAIIVNQKVLIFEKATEEYQFRKYGVGQIFITAEDGLAYYLIAKSPSGYITVDDAIAGDYTEIVAGTQPKPVVAMAVPPEPVIVVPTINFTLFTRSALKTFLDEHGVSYDQSATKPELIALAEGV